MSAWKLISTAVHPGWQSLTGLARDPGIASRARSAPIDVPNDPSNSSRALLLLQRQGLIEQMDPTNIALI
jgi:hypothetical protein